MYDIINMTFYYTVHRYLGLLPEGEYNKETLDLYAGVVDQTKVRHFIVWRRQELFSQSCIILVTRIQF